MTTMTQLYGGGSGPVSSLQRSFNVTGTFAAQVGRLSPASVLSGSMTAAASKNILTVAGRGRLLFAAVSVVDATPRTLTPNIKIDGLSILAPPLSFSSTGEGCDLVGAAVYTSDSGIAMFEPIDFQSSLVIDLTGSLTETDKATIYYRYQVWL